MASSRTSRSFERSRGRHASLQAHRGVEQHFGHPRGGEGRDGFPSAAVDQVDNFGSREEFRQLRAYLKNFSEQKLEMQVLSKAR